MPQCGPLTLQEFFAPQAGRPRDGRRDGGATGNLLSFCVHFTSNADGETTMKHALLSGLTLVMCLGFLQAAAPKSDSGKPQYTSDNQLLPPRNFREWIFLSSGLGMSYIPGSMDHQMFTNVFVPQWAYADFLKSGKWPDKTMFVVEERGSETKGSINKVRTLSKRSHGIRRGSERRVPFSGEVGLLQFRRDCEASPGQSQGRVLAVS